LLQLHGLCLDGNCFNQFGYQFWIHHGQVHQAELQKVENQVLVMETKEAKANFGG
jgi:hypothetical protein